MVTINVKIQVSNNVTVDDDRNIFIRKIENCRLFSNYD